MLGGCWGAEVLWNGGCMACGVLMPSLVVKLICPTSLLSVSLYRPSPFIFCTKPAEKGNKNYTVVAMAFSPDSIC